MNGEGTRIDVQSDNGVSVIALIGEFDLASRDELQQQFQALREANRRRVVLDLSRTRFLDSTVLGALARAHLDGLDITIRGRERNRAQSARGDRSDRTLQRRGCSFPTSRRPIAHQRLGLFQYARVPEYALSASGTCLGPVVDLADGVVPRRLAGEGGERACAACGIEHSVPATPVKRTCVAVARPHRTHTAGGSSLQVSHLVRVYARRTANRIASTTRTSRTVPRPMYMGAWFPARPAVNHAVSIRHWRRARVDWDKLLTVSLQAALGIRNDRGQAIRGEWRVPVHTQPEDKSTTLTRAIGNMTGWLGSFPAIVLSFVLVAAWFVGAYFVTDHFANNTYQLVINTGTTIITFWMVFIIQNTQNRDGRAIQAKVDAESEVLRRVAEQLEINDDEALLARTVGLEDAPEKVIKDDQDLVRRAAVDTGQHGLVKNT